MSTCFSDTLHLTFPAGAAKSLVRVTQLEAARSLVLNRYNERQGEWTLQSGFDGDALLARPSIELISVEPHAIREAKSKIAPLSPLLMIDWCPSWSYTRVPYGSTTDNND